MHKLYTGGIALLLGTACFAQQKVDVTQSDVNVSSFFHTVGGEPFTTARFTKLVEGTPYFREEWNEAVVVLADGQQYKNLQVKLDLYSHELHYMDEKGSERIALTPVKEVVLTDTNDVNYRFIYARFLPPADERPAAGWYHWLRSGRVQLYKYYTKEVSENKPYGSATTEERMRTSEKYLVYLNKTFYTIKRPKDAPSVLSDKKAELSDFLHAPVNKDLTPDALMVALVSYYESLLPASR